ASCQLTSVDQRLQELMLMRNVQNKATAEAGPSGREGPRIPCVGRVRRAARVGERRASQLCKTKPPTLREECKRGREDASASSGRKRGRMNASVRFARGADFSYHGFSSRGRLAERHARVLESRPTVGVTQNDTDTKCSARPKNAAV